ncbi:YihA family ribosome biogenesis GTP-binding protein [Putridiphycobacter roseus]|uniref:Probable GTP-binding protein EngB n=1 Tax=Putridiphycobacter roseus TaxID=2219161 RepID=A0A2W1ND44_9FLAO|nr:ribosome biogenesis GTP-binding protein YihA/YsxC [Putridiphycobacter roseus]PZE17023.1 YihA family ribosome biogenesis GTP-binding protein [Putridiphycobacter roseus]
MRINQAEFIISNSDISRCPAPTLPEYAFIGRSNVGKSSLINMLTNNKKLAKISSKPGKTQLINHFLINKTWYLVDLPGYGFAKIAKSQREKWERFVKEYVLTRENLLNLFVLIDSRIPPQKIDLEFMEMLGENGVPFSMIFTKMDKLSSSKSKKMLLDYQKEMLKTWEEIPPYFMSSSISGEGKEIILDYIDQVNPSFQG